MDFVKINQQSFNGVKVEDLPSWGKIDTSGFTKFRRAPFSNGRFYFNKRDPFYYSGLTTPIGAAMNKTHLVQAQIRAAYEGRIASFEWDMLARYGTMFHLLVGLHEEGEVLFDFEEGKWESVLDSFINEYKYHDHREMWRRRAMNDMAAYFLWKKEMGVTVLSTEVMVSDVQSRIATPLDLVVEMRFNKKLIRANVNIKTGDHPFTKDNLLQVECEAYMWNRSPGRPFDLDGSFAWRPKDRDRNPGGWELSRNCIGQSPDMVEYIMSSVKPLRMNEPNGLIVRYLGTGESDFTVVALTPQQWLAEWQQR